MSTLVTGGAGYIGSHVVYALLDAGRDPVVVDDLSTGVRENLPDEVPLTVADAGNADVVDRLIDAYDVTDCIHFAGSTVVPESVAQPLDYYRNNTCVARNLIAACIDGGVDRFIFSSTAAIYGDLDEVPVPEDAPKEPLNPYGRSKWMVEQILEDTAAADDAFDYCALRYFNVAGADPEGRTGHAKPTSSTLIKVTTETALGLR
ncbi:MAG: NAD-dependent epimerase/dehydratase family protein, partial [Bradymonadaceae bacterium]